MTMQILTMQARTLTAAAAVAALAAATFAAIAPSGAGGDKISFPANYGEGAMYMTFDAAANKTYRELYASADALAAAKKGAPMPNGTVITMVQYAAKLDGQGNPEKDANGRFIKTDTIVGYGVMEKRAGWGTEYPDNVRNGEWEYQAFKADGTPNTGANLTACFNCHKPQDKQDFVFSYEKMKTAAK
jgi:Cytochrome P460